MSVTPPNLAEQIVKSSDRTHFPIPARHYYAPDLYDGERERIFGCCWRYVGHSSQFARAGDYLTLKVADEDLFVIRGRDGALRAFYNVCQHRAARLLDGSGNCPGLITCPFHSWAYDLEGFLRGAANADQVAGFRNEDFSLEPVRVDVFAGFVFVNLDAGAASLVSQAAELESLLRRFCPQIEKLELAAAQEYLVEANWKVVVDNFIESYHLKLSGPAHKAFTDLVDCASYQVVIHGGPDSPIYLWSSHVARPGPNKTKVYDYTDTIRFGVNNDCLHVHLFPDIGFLLLPGPDLMVAFITAPAGPESCHQLIQYFTPSGEIAGAAKAAMDYFSLVLGPEDNELCRRVQCGVKSRGYRAGRLMVDASRSGISEHAVERFHAQILARLNT